MSKDKIADIREYLTRTTSTGGSLDRAAAEARGQIFDTALQEALAEAWDDAVRACKAAIKGIPSWTDPDTGESQFDLLPLGPDETSESGARSVVIYEIGGVLNPYREADNAN